MKLKKTINRIVGIIIPCCIILNCGLVSSISTNANVEGMNDFTTISKYEESISIDLSINLGDINNDSIINSKDASMVLRSSAKLGSTGKSNFTEDQEKIADVNKDGIINAKDATLILGYAAYCGVSRKVLTFQPYLYEKNNTVKRVSVDSNWVYGRTRKIDILENSDSLKNYFTNVYTPRDIGDFTWYGRKQSTEILIGELQTCYPDSFYDDYNILAILAWEPQTNTYHEIRDIARTDENKVIISIHTINNHGEPLSGAFVLLIAVDKTITTSEQIILKETMDKIE